MKKLIDVPWSGDGNDNGWGNGFQNNDEQERQEQPELKKPNYREKILRLQKENKTCFDCGSNCPRWCSVSHGTWICIICAGEHRCLGVHISVVRSASLDSWNEKYYMYMLIGGNERATKFFREKEILKFAFQAKYQSGKAREYRELLKDEVKKKTRI